VFYEPRAPRTPSCTTLPVAARMGAGTYEHIAWRNGWRSGSTLVTILAGDHFTDHQHFDKGQFLIYHRGGLAVDRGAYDGMYKKGGHSGEYAPRTLAHNCLLVYDPAQDFAGYTNDGGQLLIRGKQHHRDWPEFLAHRDREGLHAAEVRAYEAGKDYDYARIDLARAYGPKVKAYERSFVYLPGRDVMVVYDRIDSMFEKRWLLHVQDEPEVRDDVVTVRRREGGLLTVRTLVHAEHEVAAVGGSGREFLNPFNGVNYPPSNAATAAPSREAGAWRIEVTGRGTGNEFLHAISISGAVAARAVKGVAGAQFLFDGVGEVAAFPAALPAAYEISGGAPARHFVAGLPAGTRVIVEVNGKRRSARTDDQGVLRFEDGAKGARKIRLRVQR
jgi:heparin/heparan-sulfate lyase